MDRSAGAAASVQARAQADHPGWDTSPRRSTPLPLFHISRGAGVV